MIVAGQRLPILIATKPVDFRCGHNALALIVQTELKLDPHSGVTVVFRSKRGGQVEDPCVGWHRNGADLQGPGTGQLRLAEDSGRGYAAVSGAGGSLVRRSGLAAGGGAKGAGTDCGRMTQRVEFGIVLLGFLFRIW